MLPGAGDWFTSRPSLLTVPVVIAIACLCMGWLAPWSACVCGLGATFAVFVMVGARPEQSAISAALSATVSLLGPGAYSVDSLVYGRPRRILPPDD